MTETQQRFIQGKPGLKIRLLALSLTTLFLFCASFTLPFVSSDFDITLPSRVSTAIDTLMETRDALKPKDIPSTGSQLDRLFNKGSNLLKTGAAKLTDSVTLKPLESFLGPVSATQGKAPISWQACLDDSSIAGQSSSRDAWRSCLKRWIVHTAGIPVGIQTIPGIIGGLFGQREFVLGVLLLLFSVCFPLTKVLLCCFLSAPWGTNVVRLRAYWLLEHSSKWSMTDVFVVAMLVTFFKAESFNFHFKAESGLYTFAAAAILSSLAVILVKKNLRSMPS